MTEYQSISDQHSVCTEAFGLAISQLQERSTTVTIEMKEAVTLAIIDLARAGQRDPLALARYAVSKVR